MESVTLNKHISALALDLCASLFLFTGAAHAAAGALDPSFGNGGKTQTSFGMSVRPAAAVLQADGKIVIATGFSNTSIATEALGLVRYNANGILDKSFGKNGSVKVAFTNFINEPSSMALQADGKIVVAGTASSADGQTSEFAVARFNPNGSVDNSFGVGGKVTTNFVGVMLGGVLNPANAVVIQPDGKILVGGGASECEDCLHRTALARYNADGSLDSTFGSGGKVDLAAIDTAYTLALLSTGEIVAVSAIGDAFAQFTAQGALESGITSGPIAAFSHGGTFIFQSDGKPIQVNSGADNGNDEDSDVSVIRFNATGLVDITFNTPAFEFGTDVGTGNGGEAAALDASGKVIVGGYSGNPSLFGVARLNTDGSLDSTFGTSGRLTTRFRGTDQVLAVLVQTDGKIVAVGQTVVNATGIANLALARYLAQ